MNKIWSVLAAIGGVLLAIFTFGQYKQRQGRDEAHSKQRDEVLSNAKKAKESRDNSRRKSDNDAIDRMRKRAPDSSK